MLKNHFSFLLVHPRPPRPDGLMVLVGMMWKKHQESTQIWLMTEDGLSLGLHMFTPITSSKLIHIGFESPGFPLQKKSIQWLTTAGFSLSIGPCYWRLKMTFICWFKGLSRGAWLDDRLFNIAGRAGKHCDVQALPESMSMSGRYVMKLWRDCITILVSFSCHVGIKDIRF